MRPDELLFFTNARSAPRFIKSSPSVTVSIRLEPDDDEDDDDEKTQRCCSCRKTLMLDKFFKANNRNLGVSSECKECKKLRSRLAYAANPARKISAKVADIEGRH